MASSGSYDFSITRDEIINLALQHVNVIGEGESGTTSQISEASKLLNMIVKLRAADGMPSWALKRGYVLPFSGASSINTNSHVVSAYDTTTLSADSAAGDTTLTVTSISGFSNGDQIGIELDDGTVDWTTINGAPGGTTITITDGVTSAASSGNRVYGYTASSERVQKPLRIVSADLLDVSSGTSSTLSTITLEEYYMLSNRTSASVPNMMAYDPNPSSETALNTNGTIFVWPRFNDGDSVIEFTYQRPFQDFDAATDNPDFPQAFYLPLMLELAAILGIKAGVTIEERRELRKEAIYYMEQALFTVAPEGSLFFGPK